MNYKDIIELVSFDKTSDICTFRVKCNDSEAVTVSAEWEIVPLYENYKNSYPLVDGDFAIDVTFLTAVGGLSASGMLYACKLIMNKFKQKPEMY